MMEYTNSCSEWRLNIKEVTILSYNYEYRKGSPELLGFMDDIIDRISVSYLLQRKDVNDNERKVYRSTPFIIIIM